MKIANREYKISLTGKVIIGLLIAAFILFIITLLTNPHRIYYNCASLKADGIYTAKVGDSHYQAAMDKDHDGVSCE